jgi:hypothetical protein
LSNRIEVLTLFATSVTNVDHTISKLLHTDAFYSFLFFDNVFVLRIAFKRAEKTLFYDTLKKKKHTILSNIYLLIELIGIGDKI